MVHPNPEMEDSEVEVSTSTGQMCFEMFLRILFLEHNVKTCCSCICFIDTVMFADRGSRGGYGGDRGGGFRGRGGFRGGDRGGYGGGGGGFGGGYKMGGRLVDVVLYMATRWCCVPWISKTG